MVLVPGGYFLYGPKKEQREEKPFYIDRFPVTNARFAQFVRETGHKPGRAICGCCWLKVKDGGVTAWTDQGKPDDHPAVNVTWIDAVAYCRWAGKELPTEFRWEKAARGTDGRRYPWGNEWAAEVPRNNRKTHQVGLRPGSASPFGMQDALGNVWELTVGWTDTYPR
ncbi:SUMF1/EgtB/PvdO family nonheme iron enzyme, partial [bacterium]|nr:SUMF1/EgtB/PvdO family nonheme iron enzyme [bacterium]